MAGPKHKAGLSILFAVIGLILWAAMFWLWRDALEFLDSCRDVPLSAEGKCLDSGMKTLGAIFVYSLLFPLGGVALIEAFAMRAEAAPTPKQGRKILQWLRSVVGAFVVLGLAGVVATGVWGEYGIFTGGAAAYAFLLAFVGWVVARKLTRQIGPSQPEDVR